jgi:hypothetical protein
VVLQVEETDAEPGNSPVETQSIELMEATRVVRDDQIAGQTRPVGERQRFVDDDVEIGV